MTKSINKYLALIVGEKCQHEQKVLFGFVFMMQVCSCFNIKSEKLYLKEVSCQGCNIEWFCYSNIGNISRDYITIKCDGEENTICESTNVKDIYVDQRGLNILFYGTPSCYDHKIKINKVIETKIDTNYTINEPRYRSTYKK